ncbi:DUF2721 domain-containing protein [Hyphococcus sp.]|uniref:DUF2721 domain-containing protein n=1 Tax=Hyphococcus sp. TaxID=2038636 RepID=UPI002086959C|nr:MAG: hypothetical protein DHS20C04_07780 [Marinicaulis sp.]
MNELSNLAHTIELSVAPVFLLAGIGAFLNVVASRLGRVVDRARNLEDRLLATPEPEEVSRIKKELVILDRRVRLSQRAVVLFSLAGLLVCLVVATLFIGEFIVLQVAAPVAMMFIAAMLAMIGGLSLFLLETTIATRTIRVRAELLSK